MDIERKLELIRAPPTEEILTESDLRAALERGIKLKHYIGFEISGLVHLGTGLITMSKVADLQKAGVECSIFLADVHSWLNEKLGGDMELIRDVAGNYFKHALLQSLKVMGGKPSKVKVILGSELYEEHGNDYWLTVLEISKNMTLARARRSITIMGRQAGEEVNFGQLIYPPMQVADIFIQGINLPHGGTDQRKAHVIARDVGLTLKLKPLIYKKEIRGKIMKEKYKPIALHTHLLLGLGKPPIWPVPKNRLRELWTALKMSKSKPETCVFIHDMPEQIHTKIARAFCPAREVEFNPILDWCKHIIFKLHNELEVPRPKKYGGNLHFYTFEDLAKVYAEGKLHPADLKPAVAAKISEILEPVRRHFQKPKYAKYIEQLRQLIKK